MENFVYTAAFLLALSAALYGMYASGLIAVQMKRAMLFMGSFRGDKARFSGCTGYVKRRFPAKESRKYRFDLEMELSRGEVWVELLDRNEEMLLRLDGRNNSGEVLLERGEAYRLVIRYRGATGWHHLTYQ